MVNAQCDAAGKKAGRETTPLNFDWLTLHGVLQEAVYGCRVDNEFDLRLVREYLVRRLPAS